MGSNNSKPAQANEHVFTAETPVRFSPELLQSLEDSPESDTTRSLSQDLIVQQRVHSELTRLSDETVQKLKDLLESLSESPPPVAPTPPTVEGGEGADALAITAKRQMKEDDLSREKVQAEIENLKKKLGARRLREEGVRGGGEDGGENGGKGVERAKKELVQCLRVNDRRPLDCWKEVDQFKKEVGILEGRFLRAVGE
ncbi:uncharacterized protein KY384_006307 [Bacidia gigantensis]|uniref:uncharacterized protein n=1 Tax=Bacidia gigantensis TaxID=2732470 RepID=UPI001D0560FC|nr:uncharacterized protein KY384_006307 [Bacidia gigantensis]KAG8528620.1 hypothetical protein KY384_006307 [Bacidia gigantensis]